jgi:NAD+ synthase (glutamine-hydrolysing)
LSELALGWCTYNADHMSMYAVNCDVPKTLVRYVVDWYADNTRNFFNVIGNFFNASKADELTAVLRDILDTPVSPELLPADKEGNIAQKTETILGDYAIHDFYLYHFVKYGATPEKMLFLAEKAFNGTYDSDTLKKALKLFLNRFFSQQFKRSCIPDGPKVGTLSLSPRADWRMPSDASNDTWLVGVHE